MYKKRSKLMKKILIVITLLVLTLSLVGCGKTSENPDTNNKKPSEQTKPSEETKLPEENKEMKKKLVGAWSSMYSTPLKEAALWIEFKDDNTFYYHYFNPGNTYNPIAGTLTLGISSTTIIKGKYRVIDDKKIICTELLYSLETHRGSKDSDYIDKPGKDSTWLYYFSNYTPRYPDEKISNGHEWLAINMYPNAKEKELNTYQGFQKPVD